ncbi:CdaR family protein [Oscillospiraceae bacterium 50-16]|nr:hypothetical protein [Lawsonibacter sp.]
MKHLKESRWVYILTSVLIAAVFWLYVRVAVDPTQTDIIHNVRVELSGVNILTGQNLAVAELSDRTVDLRVRAPSSVLDDLARYRQNLYVSLDVSRCGAGENRLSIREVWPNNIVNIEDATVLSRDPDTITVTVERLYARSFPLEFQLNGRVARGYQMGTPVLEPETVNISGPVEQVNRVHKVVAVLEDSSLSERYTGDLPLVMLDQDGRALTDLEVTLSAETAYAVVPVVMTKEVELSVTIEPGGGAEAEDAVVRVEPERIVVSGAEIDLDALTEVSLGRVSLSNVVGTNTFTFPIDLDPSLENVSGIASAQVTVTVEGLSTRVFEVTNIRTTTPPNGYIAEVVTQSIPVTVRGREEDLANLDVSQLRVVANLSGVTTLGGSRVPAQVYLDGTNTIGVIGEYTVAVNLSD